MLELFAIALFQIAAYANSFGTAPAVNNSPTATSASSVGSGGWGNDVHTTTTTTTAPTVGSGGWGNDVH